MAIKRLSLKDATTEKSREIFNEHGCIIFSNVGLSDVTKELKSELRELIQLKYNSFNPKHTVSVDTMLEKELVEIHNKDRKQFVSIYDTGQALPSIFSLYNNAVIRNMLGMLGYKALSVNWTPRLRIDFPKEDEFLLPDHQDRDFNGGSETSVTVYFQLFSSGNQNPLWVRPGSHRLGNLPTRRIDVRPYILLEEGKWMDEYPEEETNLTVDEVLIFHMDIVHRSGLNRGTSPRATIQLRYNNLMDKFYTESGWPLTYRLLSVKDQKQNNPPVM